MSKRITQRAVQRAMKELEVAEPGSSEEVISQQKLRNYEALMDERKAINEKFLKTRSEMSVVLKSGASVTTGKRAVEGTIRWRRHPSYKKALIDANGEEFQQKVLARTPYTPYYHMRFITKNGDGEGKE